MACFCSGFVRVGFDHPSITGTMVLIEEDGVTWFRKYGVFIVCVS